MKKWIVILLILLANKSFAEPVKLGNVLSKIPALKNGVAYSVIDSKFNYLGTFDVAKITKWVNIEAGYAGDADSTNNKAVAVASVNLLNVKDIVTFPIIDSINLRPGVYAGLGNINIKEMTDAEFDWGISLSVIDFKF